jgi:cob(I)alamin adenosyltransferase
MGNRLSKIYTRTGDDGSTGLGDGSRVAKENLRVEAYGTVDETNSAVGVILGNSGLPPEIRRALTAIQHDLFDLGGELCIPGHTMIKAAHVDRLEAELDGLNEGLPPLKEFILPGGGPAAAACHLARAICRRGAALLVAGTHGKRRPGRTQVFEPAIGPVVRDGAGARSRCRWRGGLAARGVAERLIQPTLAEG